MHHMYERCNQMMICRRRHAKQRQNKHKYWEWVWRWRDIMTFGSVTRALSRYLYVPPLLGCLILSFIFSFSFVLFCNTEPRTERERERARNKTEKKKKKIEYTFNTYKFIPISIRCYSLALWCVSRLFFHSFVFGPVRCSICCASLRRACVSLLISICVCFCFVDYYQRMYLCELYEDVNARMGSVCCVFRTYVAHTKHITRQCIAVIWCIFHPYTEPNANIYTYIARYKHKTQLEKKSSQKKHRTKKTTTTTTTKIHQ